MACNSSEYFVGQGDVSIRRLGDDCGNATEGWVKVGNADELMISIDQSFQDHYESQSGDRKRDSRWKDTTAIDFTLAVETFSISNLVKLLQGTEIAAVPAASVTLEQVTDVFEGQIFYTENPGINTVVVRDYNAGVPILLVVDVDYTIVTKSGDAAGSSREGGIKMIDGAPNVVSAYPMVIEIDYAHVGTEGAVEALTSAVSDYQVKFTGVNMTAPTKPVVVNMYRVQFNATEELSLISSDAVMSLSFTGAILPDVNGKTFDVTKVNAVA